MNSAFDDTPIRRGSASYKWDSDADDNMLPLWVADMDFRTAPAILAALRRRVEHGVFGYTRVPEDYYDAVIRWFRRRHGWEIARESVLYTSGVVPALSAVIKALTKPGDGVLVQTPVYNCFFSSIRNNGCEVVSSPLRLEQGAWQPDWEDLERKAADPRVRLLLLCNPHNPVGRVWTREELAALAALAQRHDLTIISDEIHGELVYAPHRYTPLGSLATDIRQRSISCVSASKAFNIAGLQIANIIAEDASVRRRIDRALNINEVCDVNPFGICATIAAYNEGGEWLDRLLDYLAGNRDTLCAYCREHLPEFPLSRIECTYLAWMDCRALGLSSGELDKALRARAALRLSPGSIYGAEGEGYMRWNFACPRSRLLEGLERFRRFVREQAARH
ncbi:MAG: MalY/PatB family protein [Akkermansia sp.]